MNIVRRIVVAIVGVAVVALGMALTAPKAVRAVENVLVTVQNTSSNPVPVAGNVAVTNTVPVTGNVNATLTGTPTVNFGGSVNATVTNPSASPVLTLGTEASNSFFGVAHCSFTSNACNIGNVVTIPEGAIAVIESVSYGCVLNPGTAIYDSRLLVIAVGDITFLPVPAVYEPTNFGLVQGEVAQNLKTYIRSGGTRDISVLFLANASEDNNGLCTVFLAGYFVPSALSQPATGTF